MASFDIGPVSPMNHGGGYHYSKPRRRVPERKPPAPSPSYKVEPGAPIGAKNWLKTLFYAGAIRLSVERIAGLLRRKGDEEVVAGQTTTGPISCGPTCKIYREAVALEKQDAAARGAEKSTTKTQSTGRWRGLYLAILLVLAAAGAFLLTVVVLDAVFGTRSLAKLLAFLPY